ncbi:MAG: hypothetical protein ACJAZ3_001217 [Sphingobacteriales bacterium]|jgi:hypothetical protein
MDQNEQYFFQLIQIFHQSALQGMGKIVDPASQKVTKQMDQARAAIDMLDMLKEKTKGNLTENESKLLTNILTDLRLNFVDESNSKEETIETKEKNTEEETTSDK